MVLIQNAGRRSWRAVATSWLCLSLLLPLAPLMAEDKDSWEPEDFTLAPEVEKAWTDRLDEARPLRRAGFEKHLQGIIDRMRKEHALDDAQRAVLAAAAPQVIAEALRHWEQSMRKLFRYRFQKSAKSALNALKNDYKADWLSNFPAPYRQQPEVLATWAAAVRRVLPEDQFAAWEAAKQRRLERREKETAKLVRAGREKMEPERRLTEALDTLLDPLRAHADGKNKQAFKILDDAVADLKKDFIAACDARSQLWMDACRPTGTTWPTARKNGYYYSILTPSDWLAPHRERLLAAAPAEARAAYEKEKQAREQRGRTARAQARLMILELMTALSEEQLEAAQALAKKLPETDSSLLDLNREPEPWKDWQEPQAARQLAALLDDTQERLWTQGIQQMVEGARDNYSRESPPIKTRPRHPGLPPPDPAEVEAVISEHLAADSQRHAQRSLPALLRQADEAARVTGLDDSARAALELAARGALQARTEEHRQNQARYVRSQMQGATPQNARQRLAGIGGYSFYSNADRKTMLDERVDELLNREQKEKLQNFQEQTKQRRHQAVLSLLLARVDEALGLTAEQHARLMEKLTGVMEQYAPDIDAYFASWGERTPWFLRSYNLTTPAAGLEGKHLKAVLNERQMQKWDTLISARGGNYWGQVLEMHQQRKQQKRNGDE